MKVLLSEIDFDDRGLKISRDSLDEGLVASVGNFGVLEPPVLIQLSQGHRIVFGFNRLGILKGLGRDAVEAVIMPSIEPEWYISQAMLKCHRNESGPVGRLKLLFILRDVFKVDAGRLGIVGKQGLHVPENFFNDRARYESVMGLPDVIRRYIDEKDIIYRIIGDLIKLPGNAIDLLSRWMSAGTLRVTIFKSIVQMLSDICARDGDIDKIETIMPDESAGGARWDEFLLSKIHPVRYPLYSSMKSTADEIVRFYSSRGVRIDYPGYFEGESLNLSVTIPKRGDPDAIKKKINDLDMSGLRELLDLL